SERSELWIARISAAFAVCVAGYFGINPPDYVAAVVALAFGLAASSFFPTIMLGIFSKKMNKEGAIAGMISGLAVMCFYIMRFKFNMFGDTTPEDWWFGISPEGFGVVAMLVNFVVALVVMRFTAPTPQDVQDLVEDIRHPRGAKEAVAAH
ncbi:MAG TPA: cation acetate symporter, partial [Cytophagales bacterium]|nr:cation acetate symporter [Cytophagales bacterium]